MYVSSYRTIGYKTRYLQNRRQAIDKLLLSGWYLGINQSIYLSIYLSIHLEILELPSLRMSRLLEAYLFIYYVIVHEVQIQ